jgi:hypothetical protein
MTASTSTRAINDKAGGTNLHQGTKVVKAVDVLNAVVGHGQDFQLRQPRAARGVERPEVTVSQHQLQQRERAKHPCTCSCPVNGGHNAGTQLDETATSVEPRPQRARLHEHRHHNLKRTSRTLSMSSSSEYSSTVDTLTNRPAPSTAGRPTVGAAVFGRLTRVAGEGGYGGKPETGIMLNQMILGHLTMRGRAGGHARQHGLERGEG